MFGPVFVFGFRVVWGVSLWPRGCSGLFFWLGRGFSARFCFAPGFFGLVFVSVHAAPVRASHSEAGLELEHGIGSGGW